MRLIDADALMGKMRRMPLFEKAERDKGMFYVERSCIDAMPTIEAEPVKHSRWVEDHDGDEYCENCARYMPDREVTGDPSATNYCPNCGAKMDKEAAHASD